MTSYRNYISNWISSVKKEYGTHIPKDFPMQLFSSDMPDDQLYSLAMGLYNSVNGSKNSYKHQVREEKKENPDDKMFYLVPLVEKDGSVYYFDRFTNKPVMSMTRQSNGLFSYYGPRGMMTILGGRGELGQMLSNLEDGDFFHNQHKK